MTEFVLSHSCTYYWRWDKHTDLQRSTNVAKKQPQMESPFEMRKWEAIPYPKEKSEPKDKRKEESCKNWKQLL